MVGACQNALYILYIPLFFQAAKISQFLYGACAIFFQAQTQRSSKVLGTKRILWKPTTNLACYCNKIN